MQRIQNEIVCTRLDVILNINTNARFIGKGNKSELKVILQRTNQVNSLPNS